MTLKTKLEQSSITLNGLAAFEDLLLDKAKVAAKISSTYEEQAEAISMSLVQDGLTQTDMNQVAIRVLHLAQNELEEIIGQSTQHLSGHARKDFLRAQKSWVEYREIYAHFVADQHHGGNIQRLVHASVLERITSNRIAELKLERENRRL